MKTKIGKNLVLYLPAVLLMLYLLPICAAAAEDAGTVTVATFDELKEHCAQLSAGQLGESLLCTEEDFVIAEDFEIPSGMMITFRNFTVPEGVTLTVAEQAEVMTYAVTVQGELINRGKFIQQDLGASWADENDETTARISGKVFNTDRDGETLGLQCWHDVKNSDESFIVTKDTDEKYSEDDYIIADGKIQGEFKGENAFGAEITALQISADTIEKSTYQDVVAPTKEEKKVNKKATQYDVTMEVSKVEYADEETRIYVKVKNDSKYDVSIYLDSSSKVIQEGKQFEPETNYEADYPSIDEVAGGAEKEGILAVKALDPKKKAKLKVDVYSDNYEIDMKEFEIEF